MITDRMKAFFDISYDELETRYIQEEKSIPDIAVEYGISNIVIENRLRAYGILIRSVPALYMNTKPYKDKRGGANHPFFGKKRGAALSEKLRQANLGKHHTEETKQKLSKISLGNTYATESYAKGWKHTPEMLAKMSIAALGRESITEETRKKMSIGSKGHHRHTKHQLQRTREASLGNTYCKGRVQSAEERAKHSIIAKLAYKNNKDYRKKISETKLGALNPAWQGGATCYPYPIKFNKQLKELIRERDGHICQICYISQNGHKHAVHHIDYDKDNCDRSNLITLCNNCNVKANSNRSYWQRHLQYILTGIDIAYQRE